MRDHVDSEMTRAPPRTARCWWALVFVLSSPVVHLAARLTKMRKSEFPREQIERVARLYNSNKEAGAALGIHHTSFSRLCRRYGILSPWERQKRRRDEK